MTLARDRPRVVQAFFAAGRAPAWLTRVAPAPAGRALHASMPRRAPAHPPTAQAFRGPPGFLGRAASSGAPLPTPARRRMERLLEVDLSDVRVHVDPEPARIGALSFASGNDIYFAPGSYDPSSPRGAELLAHELAHVLQQRAGRVPSPFEGGIAIVQDDELEAEAEALGRLAAAARSGHAAPRGAVAQPFLDSIRNHPGPWALGAGLVGAGLGLGYWYWSRNRSNPPPPPHNPPPPFQPPPFQPPPAPPLGLGGGLPPLAPPQRGNNVPPAPPPSVSGPSKKPLSAPPKSLSTAYSYAEIREAYDRRLGFDRLLKASSMTAWTVNCSALAPMLNAKWQVALDMMITVQRKALGCTFLFKPAKQVLAELMPKIDPKIVLKFDRQELKAQFCREIRLLHTTGGSSTLTEFLFDQAKAIKPELRKEDFIGDKRVFQFLHTERILFPNYVCQIFIEMMIGRTLAHPVQLGMTREKDWIMFGNNLSVFFSLVVGTKLDANNASQKDGSRLGVLKLLSEFKDMVFWIGPDLLSLTRAYETNPKFVRAVIGQTVAPFGNPKQLLELLYWQAVAGGMSDTAWNPERILEILRGSNRLNLAGLDSPGGSVMAFIESADKLEIKALGMVAGIQKKSCSTFHLG